MLNQRTPTEASTFPLVAVAIDKDKGSQSALKWAIDNLVSKGQIITLIHVNTKGGGHNDDSGSGYKVPTDPQMKELFLPFRCFCTRKDIQCEDVVLEDTDVAKAIVEFVSQSAVEKLVLGASSKGGFVRRFKTSDVPANISKGAPDFCTVYVISKGKVQSARNAVRSAPAISPLRAKIQNQSSLKPADPLKDRSSLGTPIAPTEEALDNRSQRYESIRSPFSRPGRPNIKSFGELSLPDSGADISFIGSARPSVDRGVDIPFIGSARPSIDRGANIPFIGSARPSVDQGILPPRLSSGSDSLDRSFESSRTPHSYMAGNEYSNASSTGSGASWSSQNMEDVEAEMKRLKLELKQTMDMYSAACKEAITAKQKALELHRWKVEEEQRLEEARLAEESALALAERERARCRAAMQAAEAQHRIAELEAQKRIHAEMQALKEAEELKKAMESMRSGVCYRRYTIDEIEQATNYFAEDRKIGEGGYGPVYQAYLDHTPVAIKVLRPDAAQGRSQFQQEVQVLSCIRHPNMVLLLGACPEYGCLVYEYMANGSLEDRLFCRGNSPVIPWQHRFRIAAEIATGLLFLHQTKPEPLVHRDLKPGNILLDGNYVSKISDVGLARLVPPSIADTVTQYRMTSTAGTFCYIDPEYQQTGMLGVKSDIYSLGVMLLQIVTAKPPMGLAHHVCRAIKKGTFAEMLDPAVSDWPVEEAQRFAEIALKCTELRRKDRPDLATVILPELNRLRALGEDNMSYCALRSTHSSPMNSQVSLQDNMSSPALTHSGYDSSRTSNASNGRRSNASKGDDV